MRRDAAGLALLVLLLFAGLAATGVVLGPATSTETRYADMGREMLESGDWIIPKLNGAPLLEKPPFVYWVHAATYAVLGVSDLTARVPNLLAGLLVLGVVAAGARRFAPETDDAATRRTRGLVAAFALVTMPSFLIQAYTISIDIWLVLFTTIAGLCLLESVRTDGRPALRVVLLLHGALGLGMLAKGPLTLALVGIAGVLLAIVRRDPRPLRPLVHPAGLALFLALSVPWYLAADARIPNLLHDLVSRRLFGGIKSSADFHGHSVWIVWLPLLGTFPWLATLPGAARRRLREGGWRRGPVLAALLLAASAPLLFTFSKARLVSYTSPAFPWIALVAALGWPLGASADEEDARRRARGHLARASIATTAVALGLAAWTVGSLHPTAGAAAVAVAAALAAVAAVVLPRPGALFAHPLPRVAVVVAGLVAAASAFLATEPFRLPAAKPLYEAVAKAREPGDALGTILNYEGDWGLFPWYAREPVTFFDYPTTAMMVTAADYAPDRFRPRSALRGWFEEPARRFLLMRRRDVGRADFLGDATTYPVAQGGIYVVVTNRPLARAGS